MLINSCITFFLGYYWHHRFHPGCTDTMVCPATLSLVLNHYSSHMNCILVHPGGKGVRNGLNNTNNKEKYLNLYALRPFRIVPLNNLCCAVLLGPFSDFNTFSGGTNQTII
jgi:hypothetical protein